MVGNPSEAHGSTSTRETISATTADPGIWHRKYDAIKRPLSRWCCRGDAIDRGFEASELGARVGTRRSRSRRGPGRSFGRALAASCNFWASDGVDVQLACEEICRRVTAPITSDWAILKKMTWQL